MTRQYLIFIFLLLVTINCRSGVDARKLLFRDHKLALYTLEVDELTNKEKEVINPPFLHPIRNTKKEHWKGVLGNLRFKKESSVGNMIYHIFDEGELDDILRNLPVALDRLQSNQMLVIVSKYNDLKGVVSQDHRTTFAIFKNKSGFHIVFREIHGMMHGVDPGNYYEWSNIPAFHLLKNYEIYHVEKEDYFEYNSIQGFSNRLWIFVDNDRFREVNFKKRPKLGPKVEPKDTEKEESNKGIDMERPTKITPENSTIERDID